MEKYELYFYDTSIEMLMDQGRIAVEKGAGGTWNITFSGEITNNQIAGYKALGIDAKLWMVVIKIY